ncbi:hypothetical protein ERHA55_44090 [Erwinia rhapontici]|nr:hypothetical protein ERHA55_44090 [Erwinia rhapontici]
MLNIAGCFFHCGEGIINIVNFSLYMKVVMRFPFILVSPARAENVGAAARAMKTMGFSELRIVDSQAHLDPAARRVAHGRVTFWIMPATGHHLRQH